MTLEMLLIISSCISFIFSFLTVGFSIKAIIEVKAMQKSTHSLEYVPIDPTIDRDNQEYLAREKWGTSDAAIQEQNEMFREDLEDKLPEFVPSDEDKEIFSL